jgi:hypothetical protein
MLAFRSLALGLLAACVMLLAARPTVEVRVFAEARGAPPSPKPTRAVSIVDAAPNLTGPQLLGLVRLAPDEYIAAVDDRHADKSYVDLEIVGDTSVRRVVVLVH